MLNTNSMAAEPKPLHTDECTINGICFQVSVCQSPNAETSLKQKMRSIILQRAEKERKPISPQIERHAADAECFEGFPELFPDN